MKQNLQKKRRVFQNAIRNTQLQNIFNRLRQQTFHYFTQNSNKHTLDQIMSSLPMSLPQLFNFMKDNQSQSSLIAGYLIQNLPNWINKCGYQVLDIQFWSFLMEILIKMLENCSSSFQKQVILKQSQEIALNKGCCLAEQNKTSKYDIFLLIMDYYLIGLTTLETCKRSKNYIKMVISTLQTLNWRTKDKELLKFIYFCNNLLDLCISQNDKAFLFQLFLQKSTIYIHFMSIIEQIYLQSYQHQQQNIILLILISLINLTFSVSQKKFYKMIIATDFQLFLANKIEEIQINSFLVQFYLQLIRNLMLNYPQFRVFIQSKVGYLLDHKQMQIVLWSEIKQLSNVEYE